MTKYQKKNEQKPFSFRASPGPVGEAHSTHQYPLHAEFRRGKGSMGVNSAGAPPTSDQGAMPPAPAAFVVVAKK